MSLALCLWIVLAVMLLLWADVRGRARAAGLFKTGASLGFVALAFVLARAASFADFDPFARYVLVGLILCAGGDVALALPGERAFTAGLVLFLLGHVAYIVAASTRVAVVDWASARALLPVSCSGLALAWLWPHLGKMRGPVLAYVIAITIMLCAAISVFVHTGGAARWFIVGAALFYASDLSVARDRFVEPGFPNRVWGLPAYYAGQVSMAWSIAEMVRT